MGRPPSCGCCGVGSGVDPVSTCNTNYWTQPWVTSSEANVSRVGSSPFVPSVSGDLQQVRWQFPNWSVSGNLGYGSDCCPENYYDLCEEVGSGVIQNYFYYFPNENIKCDFNSTDSTHYNFLYKKTFNVESGVSVYGQITAVQNPCLDASISISGIGLSEIISRIYPNWLAWSPELDIGCVNSLCNWGQITLNSGTYDIVISGSTSGINFDPNPNCPDCCVPLKGFVDFLIIPCTNAQNIDDVSVNSVTNFDNRVFSYQTRCSNGAINGISDFCSTVDLGVCYDCYLQCDDCESWYRSHSMPFFFAYSGDWWSYQNLLNDPNWLAYCSGNAEVCGTPTPQDSGRFNNGIQYPVGNGWAIGPSQCGINTVTGVCYNNGVPYPIYYSELEDIGACCIDGDCCEMTCKDCADAGGDWGGVGSRCFGENPIFCSEGGA